MNDGIGEHMRNSISLRPLLTVLALLLTMTTTCQAEGGLLGQRPVTIERSSQQGVDYSFDQKKNGVENVFTLDNGRHEIRMSRTAHGVYLDGDYRKFDDDVYHQYVMYGAKDGSWQNIFVMQDRSTGREYAIYPDRIILRQPGDDRDNPTEISYDSPEASAAVDRLNRDLKTMTHNRSPFEWAGDKAKDALWWARVRAYMLTGM